MHIRERLRNAVKDHDPRAQEQVHKDLDSLLRKRVYKQVDDHIRRHAALNLEVDIATGAKILTISYEAVLQSPAEGAQGFVGNDQVFAADQLEPVNPYRVGLKKRANKDDDLNKNIHDLEKKLELLQSKVEYYEECIEFDTDGSILRAEA